MTLCKDCKWCRKIHELADGLECGIKDKGMNGVIFPPDFGCVYGEPKPVEPITVEGIIERDRGGEWTYLKTPNASCLLAENAQRDLAVHDCLSPGESCRVTITIMAIITGTATKPLITAAQNNMRIGSSVVKPINAPIIVAAAITA